MNVLQTNIRVPRHLTAHHVSRVMAYIVMAYIVMAYMFMAYMIMAYIVVANIVMAYVIIAYIVSRILFESSHRCGPTGSHVFAKWGTTRPFVGSKTPTANSLCARSAMPI